MVSIDSWHGYPDDGFMDSILNHGDDDTVVTAYSLTIMYYKHRDNDYKIYVGISGTV